MRTAVKTILMAASAATLLYACRSTYPTMREPYRQDAGTADIKHGERVALNSCGGCHLNPVTGRLSGMPFHDVPRILGREYTANITTSASASRAVQYSDAELAYMLRTGIKKDGKFVPFMLRPNLSAEDMRDLIAFLRSGTGAAAADDHFPGKPHLNFLGKAAINGSMKPLPYRPNVASPDNELAEGRYLVDNIGCFHCHSKKITALNYLHPEETKGYLAGGAKFKMPDGKIRGSNITMDKETGIGYYSKEDFRQAVQHMTAPKDRSLRPPMEAFHLTNRESDAIYAYIQTVPAKHHWVKGQVHR